MKKSYRSTISLVGAAILLSSAITPSTLFYFGEKGQYEVSASESAQAADLADVSILKGTQLSSNNGTAVSDGVKLEKNADSTYNLDLSFKGTAIADVGLASPKVIVFALPEELRGKIDGPMMINAHAKLLPIVPGDVPVVKDLILNVGTLVTRLLSLAKPLGLELDSLENAFKGLNTLQDLGSYEATFEGKLSPDGKYVMVDFTDGLGQYVRTTYAKLFDPLKEAVDGLKFSGLLAILNPVLNLLKPAVNGLLDLVGQIANGTSDVLTQALQANVLGDVTFDFTAKVSDITAEKAKITAMAVNKPVIDLALLNTIHANGDAINLYFDNIEEDPLAKYSVSKPIVKDIIEGVTSLSGNVEIIQPIPTGVTFQAKVMLPDGTTLSGVVTEDGTFVIPFNHYEPKENDLLQIVVEASVDNYTKKSEPTIKQVIADPFLRYVVAKPVVSDILDGMPSLDGQVKLNQPIPHNVTFTAKVELPDGTTLTGAVDDAGYFIIPFERYQPQGNDELKVRIEASDGERRKVSNLETKQVIVDPLKYYQVPIPQFKNVNEGSQYLTGSIELGNIPDETKLFVQVQFPDGSLRKVSIEKDGTFSIFVADKNLKEGNPLRLVTLAEHIQSYKGKNSDNVVFAVGKIPSLDGYVVPTPVVVPIFVGDTAINGTVKITNPPEGTQFIVRVRFPGNIYEEAPVNGDGTFTLDISKRQLAAGTSITFNTTATLGNETAASGRVIVSVGAK